MYRNKFNDWTLIYRAGVAFASDDYHDYYYNIAPEYVTETRSYFNADGGYSGWNNQIAFSRSFNHSGISAKRRKRCGVRRRGRITRN